MTLEKASRVAEDIPKTRMCCLTILDICFAAKEWKRLNEQITVLAKRRGQLKQVKLCTNSTRKEIHYQAIQAFVRQAMGYIGHAPTQEIRVELIKTLQAVTEGKVRDGWMWERLMCVFKIFVEIERARLTKRLARIKEAEGNIIEAADVLQEVAVV